MRPGKSYRAARRSEAKKRGLKWGELERIRGSRIGPARVVDGKVVVADSQVIVRLK